MVMKIACLVICIILLIVCYRTQFFAERVLRLKEVTDRTILRIKIIALIIAIAVFLFSLIFC